MRIVRALYGRPIAFAIGADDDDTVTLSWPGGSSTVSVESGLCTIDASTAAMIPAPGRPGDHTSCRLSWEGTTWLVEYVYNHTQHAPEARHRWQT